MIALLKHALPALVGALVLVASPAASQTSDPNRLTKLLNVSDIVMITDESGVETRGRVARIGDGTIDVYRITPGGMPNEYLVGSVPSTFSIETISTLSRADATGPRREPLYQRHDTFGTLRDRVKAGEVVRVIERSGTRIIGKVVDVSLNELVLAPQPDFNARQRFAATSVATIERPARIWDGAVKGGVTAALLTTLVLGITGCSGCTGVGTGYAATIGIGAGIGLGIDALFGPTKVYRAR